MTHRNVGWRIKKLARNFIAKNKFQKIFFSLAFILSSLYNNSALISLLIGATQHSPKHKMISKGIQGALNYVHHFSRSTNYPLSSTGVRSS
jgi:hypothetical protein